MIYIPANIAQCMSAPISGNKDAFDCLESKLQELASNFNLFIMKHDLNWPYGDPGFFICNTKPSEHLDQDPNFFNRANNFINVINAINNDQAFVAFQNL